jgi:RNA polymerase sigma-70 factor, ECF subfamily
MGNRDPESFDDFYAGSVGRVISQLYAMTGDRAEAEDVVQEAYTRAWERWAKIARYADPESWVRTVAWRISVSSWPKARSRLAAHRRDSRPDPVPEVSPDYVAMISALRVINADQRRAVVLYHVVGLSVQEIARETGASPAAVKARLVRGRQALAAQLHEEASLHV